MKKFFCFIAALTLSFAAQAQWGPDVRLTQDTAVSLNTDNCLAVSGDTLHAVWCDHRNGNDEIYYKRSVDGGLNWGNDIRLTSDPAMSNGPTVASSGPFVIMSWSDNCSGNPEIYCKRSLDGGETWGPDIRLSYTDYNSYQAAIAISGSTIHLVWHDWVLYFEWNINYMRSLDSGLTWEAPFALTYGPGNSLAPSIAASGTAVHVVWDDDRTGNREIFYKRSFNGGTGWENDVQLTDASNESRTPSIAVSGMDVHLVWYDRRNGNYEIYYKHSTDGGETWMPDTRLTNDDSTSINPSIALSGSAVHVVWMESRDIDQEMYYMRSDDNGTSWSSEMRLTNSMGFSKYPSVAVSGPVIHTIWTDYRDGNAEIYYKQDPTGAFPVGLEENPEENSDQDIVLYPNPAGRTLNIVPGSSSEPLTGLRFSDLYGRTVIDLRIPSTGDKNSYAADVSEFAEGIYLLEIEAGSKTYFRKVIIRK